MKTIGLDISKYLKFKPYEAINLAKGVNSTLVVLGFALELWDSYSKHKKEEEFKKAKLDIEEAFNLQRKELIELLDAENFKEKFFPTYVELQEKLKSINLEVEKMKNNKQLFDKWIEEGKKIEENQIIDVEVYENSN